MTIIPLQKEFVFQRVKTKPLLLKTPLKINQPNFSYGPRLPMAPGNQLRGHVLGLERRQMSGLLRCAQRQRRVLVLNLRKTCVPSHVLDLYDILFSLHLYKLILLFFTPSTLKYT